MPPRYTPQSEAVGFRLHRAKTRLDELETWLGSYRHMDPYLLSQGLNADTGFYELVAEVKFSPPLYVSVIAGESAQSLRAVLDYLAWGLTTVEDENLLWPFKDKREHFKSWKCGAGPKNMSGDAITAIDQFQPYQNTTEPNSLQQVLSVLNDLARVDKHRTLILTEGLFLGADAPENPKVTWHHGAFDGRRKVLATWQDQIDRPSGDVTLSVAFEQRGPGRGHDVQAVLGLAHHYIAEEVVPAVLPYFQR